MTWLHNVTKSHQGTAASCNKNLSQGKEILQKPEMQIFVSNQSLVLQKVSERGGEGGPTYMIVPGDKTPSW